MAEQTFSVKNVRAFDMVNGITYMGKPVNEEIAGMPLEVITLKEWVQCPTASLGSNAARVVFRNYIETLQAFYKVAASREGVLGESFELKSAHIVASYHLG